MLPVLGVCHAPFAAINLQQLLTASRDLCRILVLVRASIAARHPEFVTAARALFDVRIVADLTVIDDTAALQLDGITTFHDDELEWSDGVAGRCGLPGSGCSERWDKLEQRRLFNVRGLSPRAGVPVDGPADLLAAATSGPGALKPRRSTGSSGIALLRNEREVSAEIAGRRQWQALLYEDLLPSGDHPSGEPWLADYVSVETVSGAAGHRHVAIFDKLPVAICRDGHVRSDHAIRETGDLLPARLPSRIQADVLATTTQVLDALDVRHRATHTELLVTDTAIDVIEVNGRLGGEVARMVSLLGGPDVTRVALAAALGHELPMTVTDWHRRGAGACVYVPFPARSGRVRSRASRHDLRGLAGISAVDEVAVEGALLSDSMYRAAKFTLTAKDISGLDEALSGALDRIAELFVADGLDRDPWLLRIRDGLDSRQCGSAQPDGCC